MILGSDKVFFHFFKDFFERAPVVVCHAPPCFLSFYRISQRLPRKKLRNFCGRSAPVGCPNFISDAMQSRSCAFHEIRKEVHIACHSCAASRIIF
ncbi:MAG: hypothetical protein DMF47_00130 [Verrucomicrobia bacterium]|nr:MAG: hypothetical protein DMF47_00130 [Verrucomicrobiota bacterium]